MAESLAKMVQDIWERKGMPTGINKAVTAAFAQHFTNGAAAGYGKGFDNIDYDTPDGNMLASLQKNIYQFSAAKNYQQLKALSQALIDDNGKLRTWNDFKQAAYAINDEHVNVWLKTEYHTAVASAQMAGKWVDIQQNKSLLGILEFDAVMDARTSDLCRGFNGVRKPVDDPFWKQYYPLNHFLCRSTVRQRSGRAITPDSSIVIPDKLPEMFKVNLAERGLVFPPAHPYWDGVPQHVLSEALQLIPNANDFVVIEQYAGKGVVSMHKRVDVLSTDFNAVKEVAGQLAANGSNVQILPNLYTPNDLLYNKLFTGAKPNKMPDIKINGKIFGEVKEATNASNINNLKHAIDAASKQADHVFINMVQVQDETFLQRVAKGRFIDHKTLLEIYFKNGNTLVKFTRDILK